MKKNKKNENAKNIINDVRRIIQKAIRASGETRISYYSGTHKSNAKV